ncbi:hypothetical protein K438DRAFT_1756827 [Mycena galopus ATCC 62051]|nr:hypothetical protein K438DRAFT_1756827 [Mycena galopus ATCC 62051]
MPHEPTVNEIRLDNSRTCLTLALPLLNQLNDAFGPPFVQSISNTLQALVNSAQDVKRNKNKCAQLIDRIHQVLWSIIKLHVKSEAIGSLPLPMLDNIGKFVETLHKIYVYIETQQERNKIKQFFRSNELKRLLQECHAGLNWAMGVFEIHTEAETLNNINDFKKATNIMHKELNALIETLSDTSTISERSSIYQGVNESKNSSNSFSMLPPKPKIFHGREKELDNVLKLLSHQSPRLAILGGGGMGKTSLARAALHHPDICSKFEHRFFVSAESATTNIELAALIGLHIGLDPGEDLTNSVVQYFSKNRYCLLILDNLETVWEPMQSRAGIEEFLSLLSGLEHFAIMITMRGAERPAKVQWTHPFILPLQPLSDDAAKQTLMDITDSSDITEEINQLLKFTDNMPLAVDLIAHIADYEGFSSVLERWETEKTSLLSVGFDRHKELLSLLSILPNGLSEAELVQSRLEIPNILRCKVILQATSLVYLDPNKRLLMLMPIREYVRQFLPPSQSHVQALFKYFQLLLELYKKYNGEQLQPVINQITLNLANLHELMKQGFYNRNQNLADIVYCALCLNSFCRLTGRDRTILMDHIQPILPQLHNPRLETVFLIEALKTSYYKSLVSAEMIAQIMTGFNHINDPLLECIFYEAVGNHVIYWKSNPHQATEYLQKALRLSELSADIDQQSSVLISIGFLKRRIGDYTAAKLNASDAERLSKLSANLYHEARALRLQAICSRYLGEYKECAAQLRRAKELVGICGLSGGNLDHNITLAQAEIHLLKSEYTQAKQMFAQDVEASSSEQNFLSHANALLNIALIDIIIGRPTEDVSHHLDKVREIFQRKKDHKLTVALCDMVQAKLELREERFNSAKIKFQECFGSFSGVDYDAECFCLEHLANIKIWPPDAGHNKWPTVYLGANKDEDTATSLYQVSLEGFTSLDVHHCRAQCMIRLGDLANNRGCASVAIILWKAARPLFEQSLQTKDVAQIDSRIVVAESAHHQAPLQFRGEPGNLPDGSQNVVDGLCIF